MEYKIPITLECETTYSIEAENMQDAIQQVKEKFDIPFPSNLLKVIGDDLNVVNMEIDTSKLYTNKIVESQPREVKWLNEWLNKSLT